MSVIVPMVRASQIWAIPSHTESPAPAVSASTLLMSIRPPPSYALFQGWSAPPSLNTYCAVCCTKRLFPAEQACTHSHMNMATRHSWNPNWPAWTPMNSSGADAVVGRLGLVDNLSPVRNVSQLAVPRSSPRHASATYVLRYIGRSPRG